MGKKFILAMSMCLGLSFGITPEAKADLVTGKNDYVWVFKFETGPEGRTLVRQYKRKLGDVVLSKKNWNLILYFVFKVKKGAYANIGITDIVLLDDELEQVNFIEPMSETPMKLDVAKEELCAYSTETGRFSICLY